MSIAGLQLAPSALQGDRKNVRDEEEFGTEVQACIPIAMEDPVGMIYFTML
jgi:hypothetical protein